jgi:hypothetical protein
MDFWAQKGWGFDKQSMKEVTINFFMAITTF